MDLGKDFKNVRESFSSDEKMIGNAFRLEILYKRYKVYIWGISVSVIIALCGYFINDYITERNAAKYSKIYNELLQNPSDEALQKQLESGNNELYKLYLAKRAFENDNVAVLNEIGSDKNPILYIAKYSASSFDRDVAGLEAVDKFVLGDLAQIEAAYVLIQQSEFSRAKAILDKISLSSPLKSQAQILLHYLATKEVK